VLVAALAVLALALTSGIAARVVDGVGSSISAAIAKLGEAPAPSAAAVAPPAPILETPTEPYTREPTVDIAGTVPAPLVGRTNATIRLYESVGTAAPKRIAEQPVGDTVSFTFPAVALAPGANRFSATVASDGLESQPSATVSYVLDTKPPTLALTDPPDGATINRAEVAVAGRTQARSEISVRNDATSAVTTTTADADGTFEATVGLRTGPNQLSVTAIDPAGNTKTTVLSVKRGSGRLTAAISASRYRFSAKGLPSPLTVRALVVDPDGKPLADATVTFTVSVPGVPTITSAGTTDSNGRATFTTVIPPGATVGTGPATVLVNSDEFGQATDRTVIAIDK
jgi:hypothetical protein